MLNRRDHKGEPIWVSNIYLKHTLSNMNYVKFKIIFIALRNSSNEMNDGICMCFGNHTQIPSTCDNFHCQVCRNISGKKQII